jgi:hypothetical protein
VGPWWITAARLGEQLVEEHLANREHVVGYVGVVRPPSNSPEGEQRLSANQIWPPPSSPANKLGILSVPLERGGWPSR